MGSLSDRGVAATLEVKTPKRSIGRHGARPTIGNPLKRTAPANICPWTHTRTGGHDRSPPREPQGIARNVSREVLHATIREIQARNADADPAEPERLIDDEVRAARQFFWTKDRR